MHVSSFVASALLAAAWPGLHFLHIVTTVNSSIRIVRGLEYARVGISGCCYLVPLTLLVTYYTINEDTLYLLLSFLI
jgi:hypothetical protein